MPHAASAALSSVFHVAVVSKEWRAAGILSPLAVLPLTGSANRLGGRTREDYEVCAKNAAVASTGPCLPVDKADDNFDVSEVV